MTFTSNHAIKQVFIYIELKENNKSKGENFRFDIRCSFTCLEGVYTHYTKLHYKKKKNKVPEALKRNKERKFTKKKKCQKLKVKYQVAVHRKLV